MSNSFTHDSRRRLSALILSLALATPWVSAINIPVPTLTRAMIAAGEDHTLALTEDGRVWAWGANDLGQLGDGSDVSRNSPVPIKWVSQMAKIKKIDAGYDFSMALDENGVLWAWGSNTAHQISASETAWFYEPVKILLPSPVVHFACGNGRSFASDSGGKLWAWGDNTDGLLGLGHANPVQGFAEIIKPATMGSITALASCDGASYAIAASGKVWSWGINTEGQLGDGTFMSRISPVVVSLATGLPSVKAISAGNRHVMARCTNGSIWTWGSNSDGQLAVTTNPPTVSKSSPFQVLSAMTFDSAAAAGGAHSLAVYSFGSLAAWGANDEGQLGNNSLTGSSIPIQLPNPVDPQNGSNSATFVRVASGFAYSCTFKSDGSIWTWGRNDSGQLGVGDTAQRLVPTKIADLKLFSDDTDNDGLPDSWEKYYFENLAQTAYGSYLAYGVTNLIAYTRGLNPTVGDNDNDGLSDMNEIAPPSPFVATDPLNPDTDSDGLIDGWERDYGLDPNDATGSNGATGDPDDDGMSNIDEYWYGTNPNNADTDGDGLTDGWEIAHDLDPNDDGTIDPDNGPAGDPDTDGLTNAAELARGTHPSKRDSDGDGVSDWDEVMVNSTNPLTATDADGDGIPDDFENYFAKQLLAYQADSSAWGTNYAGLLAGNLDATHDYTGDGMSVRELAEILKKVAAAGPADSGYLVEQQGRRNSLQWAYYYPPSSSNSSEGTYLHSVPYDYDVLESMIPTADLSSQYLLSRIDAVAWNPSWFTSGDQMSFYNGMVESAFRRNPTPQLSSNGTKFQGIISQQRCRLIATHPGHEAYSRNYLKVIENSHYFNWLYSGVITVESFTVQFPKGKMLSDWFEFKAPIVDESGGRSAELHLRSLELEIVVPNEDSEMEPPILTIASNSMAPSNTASPTATTSDPEIDIACNGLLVPKAKRATEGAWAVVNFDDDDDRGNYTHGNPGAQSDKDFTGAVQKENDMLRLGIKKVEIAGASTDIKYRLKFDETHIKLWKTFDPKNAVKQDKHSKVTSEQTEFTIAADVTYAILYVEGIKPDDDDVGTMITAQIKIGSGAWIDGDKVKVRVAHPIVILFGEGGMWGGTDGAQVKTFAEERAGKDDLIRQRKVVMSSRDTYMVPGKNQQDKDVCYSITGVTSTPGGKTAKLAMQTEGMNIVVNGHANWGVGIAFDTGYDSMSKFFWMASNGKPAININGFSEHPLLHTKNQNMFNESFIDNVLNGMKVSPANNRMIDGPLPNIQRYPNLENPVINPPNAFGDHTLQITTSSGTTKDIHYHYRAAFGGDNDGDNANDLRTIIQQPGNSDVPANLKYRSILLNQCNSYRYYIENFKHGTAVTTWSEVSNSGITRTFIQGIVDGNPWADVKAHLDDLEPKVNGHGMFELSDF